MGKWKWSEFGKLRTVNHLVEYLDGREYRHGGYYHYTTLDTVEKILSGKEFWLSNVSGFNDKIDREQFSDPQFNFSLCFSTGINENLPLWYLYAGLDGKGASIHLTKQGIKNMIENGQYSLCELVENYEQPIVPIIPTLNKGMDMDLEFRDVIYYIKNKKNQNICDLKYNTMTNHIISSDEFMEYRKRHMGFCKGIIWYYEKETRLLVRLKDPVKRQMKAGKRYVVILKFGENTLKKIKVKFAPNIKENDIGKILDEYPAIRSLLQGASPIKLSDFSGTVEMNLCGKCKTKI